MSPTLYSPCLRWRRPNRVRKTLGNIIGLEIRRQAVCPVAWRERVFHRAAAGKEGDEEARRWAMPDLVIIDGGRGQVSAAKEVLDALGLGDLPLCGLAKEREELVLPDRLEPVVLPVTSQALYLVQRLRDEAHRFAITYHRSLRNKRTVRSALDDLPGVGPKRKRELLKVFGSAKRVREAPVEQIAAVPGIGLALAGRIKAQLES